MYTIKSFFRLAALSAGLFLSAAGCSEDNPPSGEDGTTDVSLSTRGGVETAASRLWVFGSDDKCVLNQPFGVGNGSVRLKDGRYRFATLSGMEGFSLPAAGTTDGIAPAALIPLNADGKCSAARVSLLEEVRIPQASVYEATLQPATCLLKLELKDMPEDVTLALTNMYDGVSLTGSYAGGAAVCSSYPLGSGANICLPTDGNAMLRYTSGSGGSAPATGTLDLGVPLAAGYTYSFVLQWREELQLTASSIDGWDNNYGTGGDATMD